MWYNCAIMNTSKISHFLLSTFVLVILGIANASITHADTGANPLTGWAWSSNIGWLSFNSTGLGGTAYNVYVDDQGNFGGYAWSPNIGWVSFNQSDLNASAPCPGATPAHVGTSTGQVTGWARAIAGIGRSDGWDGCVELSGTNNHPTGYADGSQGVTYIPSSKQFVGFAWGGPVVGWLKFSPAISGGTTSSVTCPTCGGVITNRVTITGACVAVPSSKYTVNSDGSVSIIINPNQSGSVTFQATANSNGPSPTPYQYSWNSSNSYGSSNQYSQTYSASNAGQQNGPTVYMKDSGGNQSGLVTCPKVNVSSTNNQNNNVQLFIGPNQNAFNTSQYSSNTSLTIRRWSPFALKWVNTLPSDYTCSLIIVMPANANNSSLWDTIKQTVSNDVNKTSQTSDQFNTDSSVSLGKYTLNLRCVKDPSHIVQSNMVDLTITGSTIKEI